MKKTRNRKNTNFYATGGSTAPKGLTGGQVSGVLGGATSLLGSAVENLKVPDVKATTFSASSNDDLMNMWSNYDPTKIKKTNVAGSALSGLATGASAGASFGPWGAAIGGVVGGLSNGLTALFGNKKKKRAENKVNNQNINNFDAAADSIEQKSMDKAAMNFAAFGGDLFANGGLISTANNFSNGVTMFNVGGTHEENPNQGIPQGIGSNGKPNLVEEGEVKYNDYIYSNRLKPTSKILKEVGLSTSHEGKTFGEIAKKLQKESEERPNDTISKNGLNDSMSKLKQAQDLIKLRKQQREQNAMQALMMKNGMMEFAEGGNLPQGIEPDMQQIMEQVAGWIQQGMSPQQIIRQLVTSGISAQQAQQVIMQVEQQLEQESQQQDQQQFAHGGNLFWDGGLNYGFNTKSANNDFNMTIKNQMFPMAKPNKPVVADDFLNFVSKGNYIPQTGDPNKFVDTSKNTTPSVDSNVTKSGGFDTSYLRYAPAVGSGIMALTDAFGITNKPDYSTADAIGNLSVKGERLSNFLSYKPMDRDYYLNKLNASTSATRRGLANSSGGNRANYQAGLLAADYNHGQNIGNLARQAEEFNTNEKQKVEEFNRGTNQFNAQQSNWEQGINTELKTKAAMLRGEAKNASNAAKMANLNNFFDNVGNIGREEMVFNMIKGDPSKYYDISRTGKTNYKGNQKKKGGKLSKKGDFKYEF